LSYLAATGDGQWSALVKALRRAEIVMRSAGGQIPVPGSVHASLLAQADKVRRLLDRLKK
jgi:hypothetical protein